MRLALHILGTEVLALTTDASNDDGPGDVTTTPVGFVHTTPLLDAGRPTTGYEDESIGETK